MVCADETVGMLSLDQFETGPSNLELQEISWSFRSFLRGKDGEFACFDVEVQTEKKVSNMVNEYSHVIVKLIQSQIYTKRSLIPSQITKQLCCIVFFFVLDHVFFCTVSLVGTTYISVEPRPHRRHRRIMLDSALQHFGRPLDEGVVLGREDDARASWKINYWNIVGDIN